jgi:hypothetical protein
MTPTGIETATFWLVAQCLKQRNLRVRFTDIYKVSKYKGVKTVCCCTVQGFYLGYKQTALAVRVSETYLDEVKQNQN